MDKATAIAACRELEQIPNIGPAVAADLRLIGVRKPRDLSGRDPFALYDALCRKTGVRHDPCVLDTFMAAVDFADGGAPKPWWKFTQERKQALLLRDTLKAAPRRAGKRS